MRLIQKLRKFAALDAGDRFILVEAAFWLGLARLLVLTVPFSVLAPRLSRTADNGSANQELLRRVRKAVITAANHVPWQAVCLPRAIAAKALLARRGCGSSLILGAGFTAEKKMIAHAWLVCGNTIVVGGSGAGDVKPLARFG